ncbi:M20 family metallopeptidase [Amycolatopsis regifaucium]|uniref:Glutamate carboxypeptidase n=1 Tax=Amycolatopsis regifaucium TaxID=546365 RepID=A0A154MP96_9PSEU|nr:M20 family metallopeptidase [Amycolatopsis regifaucium]KZB86096.1 glutamate carboxypeptidase [Amycolatopsis regifaucium]OKA04989.1 glutamate carboxypeptidase [Amycolatopsis regifaucium]SFH77729.1 glutamate carboxypeptidase [Amycolatopsis regifaucium]
MSELLADIETLVRCESPSSDHDAVARSAEVVAGLGRRVLGADPERIVIDGVTHLRWRFGDGPTRVLLLGHHDTVWPHGSLETHPFSVRDGVLRGPGCFDMKAGVVMALHAAAVVPDRAGLSILVTGDEELGSPSSRALIEETAAGCDAAFVLEASADGGALKCRRKGVSHYQVEVTGRAAHAGLEPEKGVNAGIEIAHQILAVAALADPESGTSVTPTVVSAGTTVNTVPAAAKVEVDVRVWNEAEQLRVDRAMRDLRPVLEDAVVRVTGGINRPPLEEGSSSELFALARQLSDELGLGELTAASVGGASDGNYTAGMGVPTLDGLGAVGGGAHADHEHVVVAELPRRTALLAALVENVLAKRGPSGATNPAGESGTARR